MVATVGSVQALFEADMRRYTAGLKTGERATDRFEKRVGSSVHMIGNQVAQMRSNLVGMSKAFAAAFAAGVLANGLQTIHRMVGEMAKLGDVADKIGIGVEALQRLRFGFQLAGVEANTTDMALQRFARRIADAANGSGELYKVLKANGIELRDHDGKLRSQVDILRDYADLIQRAGSEQEQLGLAFKAFDSEGAALVTGLRNGAAGLDTLMHKADEAGGVIKKELIDRAGELDDRWDIAWRNFEIRSKSAILGAVHLMDRLGGKFADYEKRRNAAAAGAAFGAMAGRKGTGKSDRIASPDERVGAAFEDLPAVSEKDQALITALQRHFGKKTVFPAGGSASDAAAAALDVYESLSQRLAQTSDRMNAVTAAQAQLNPLVNDFGRAAAFAAAKQDLLNAALQAGKADTPELRAEIDALAGKYADATAAAGRLAEAQNDALDALAFKKDLVRGAMDDLTSALEDGKLTWEEFGNVALNVLEKVTDRRQDDALATIINGKV